MSHVRCIALQMTWAVDLCEFDIHAYRTPVCSLSAARPCGLSCQCEQVCFTGITTQCCYDNNTQQYRKASQVLSLYTGIMIENENMAA